MGVALGKDDRLADLVAVVDLEAMGHQNVQHFADRVFVENPLIQSRRCDAFRQFAVIIFESVLIGFLVFLGQVVIHDTLLYEFQRRLHRQEVDQIAVLYGLRQFIAIGRNAVFQIKDLIGVLVDLVLGCGSQTDERRVKIGEDITILVVDGTMCLVADDQIKMPDGEERALLVLHGVNAVHHGLISGKHTVRRVVVFFLTKICDREIGQEVYEAALGLCDERIAVGQKQDVLDPALLHQHLDERDDRACLARAGCHDQQRLAAILLPEAVADRLDGRLLVVATGNILIHHDVFEPCARPLKIVEFFQIPFGIDGSDLPLRVSVVDDSGLKTVGEEHHRTAALLLLDQIGVELRLLTALCHVHTGTLGLDYGEDAAVVTH